MTATKTMYTGPCTGKYSCCINELVQGCMVSFMLPNACKWCLALYKVSVVSVNFFSLLSENFRGSGSLIFKVRPGHVTNFWPMQLELKTEAVSTELKYV